MRDPLHPQKRGRIFFALNAWKDFFSVRNQQIKLEAGYSYTVKVTPTVHYATADFKELPLEKRECRFVEEMPEDQTSMFGLYSQKSCVFNCMLKDIVRTLLSLNI